MPAPASVPEFLVKLIGQKYALDLQAAPYRGSAPMMADMLGNQIGAGVGSIPDFIENHKAGKIRVVAVLGNARQAALPDVPTFAELGLAGFEDVPYYGIFAPAGTPKAAIDRFADAVAKVIAMPDVRDTTHRHGPDGRLHAAARNWQRASRPIRRPGRASSRPAAFRRSDFGLLRGFAGHLGEESMFFP